MRPHSTISQRRLSKLRDQTSKAAKFAFPPDRHARAALFDYLDDDVGGSFVRDCFHPLREYMIRHTDHRGAQNARMKIQFALDFDAIDILAAAHDHVLLAIEQPEITVPIDLAQSPERTKPSPRKTSAVPPARSNIPHSFAGRDRRPRRSHSDRSLHSHCHRRSRSRWRQALAASCGSSRVSWDQCCRKKKQPSSAI